MTAQHGAGGDDALIEALRPLLRRVRTEDSAIKKQVGGKTIMAWTDEPIGPTPEGKERLRRHLNGGPYRGANPMQYNSSSTMVSLYDLDSHKGEISWPEMLAVARRLMEAMRLHGLEPMAFRSSGGKGIHLYCLWEQRQDAYSVRMLLDKILKQLGYRNGTGGVKQHEIEIFPKRDWMGEKKTVIRKGKPHVTRGSQFILPLAAESVPLGPVTLADLPRTPASIKWVMSKPLNVLVKPGRNRHEGAPSMELDTLRSALAAIPDEAPEMVDYAEWIKMLAAIHYETQGSAEGLEMAHEFSARAGNYDAEVLDNKWDTFDDDCDHPVTGGTIIRAARGYGWSEVDVDKAFGDEPAEPQGEGGGSFDPGSDEEKPGGADQPERQPDDEVPLEPFRGPMADAVAAGLATSTKPQPELTMLAALIGMASCCEGHYHLPSGGRLNLYGVGVADTGWGKDRPREVGIAVARAGGAKLIGKPASGQGLEDTLTSYQGILCEVDEAAHLVETLNGANKPAYLIELSSVLLRLFSASAGTYNPRVKAASGKTPPPTPILHPCVNLLGFATPEKLGQAANVENISEGLVGRLLFTFGRPDVPPKRYKKLAIPESVLERGQEIQRAIAVGRFDDDDDGVEIQIEPDADARLDELLNKFDARAAKAPSPFAKALLVRSFEKCERVAGVLAVWDDPVKPRITLEHVTWAAHFVNASDSAVLRFCGEYLHGGQVQADAALVLKTIKRVINKEITPSRKNEQGYVKGGFAPHSMVLRASKLDKRHLDEAIAYLFDLGDIDKVPDEGVQANGRRYPVMLYTLPKG